MTNTCGLSSRTCLGNKPTKGERMISRDFVMRQIHQLAQVLALILFNKRENPEIDPTEIIANGLNDSLGLKLEDVLALDKIQTTDICRKEGHFHPDLAVSVADLLMEDGSEAAQTRALWLYSAAAKAGGTLPIGALEWVMSDATTRGQK